MLGDLLNLCFPRYCLACPKPLVKGETLICTNCLHELPQTTYHREHDNIVAQKFYGRLPVRHAMALYKFRKLSKVRQLLHHLKYKHKPAIGKVLGRSYGVLLKEVDWNKTIDLIVPVPLHGSRLRQRGYNQSDFFAQGLAEVLNIPWSNRYLKRGKETITQIKKSKLDRLKDMEGSFYVTKTEDIRDKHLLLVDDVITTGATIEACGLVLLPAGIEALSVAAIAVAE